MEVVHTKEGLCPPASTRDINSNWEVNFERKGHMEAAMV
jgi:hypothetical protein